MFPIASVTSTGSTSSFVFDNIPGNFAHLELRLLCRGAGTASYGTNDVIQMRFNNDSGNNYAEHYTVGGDNNSGTGVFVGGFANVPNMNLGWNATASSNTNVFSASITQILDYSSTTKNKTVRLLNGYEDNRNGFGFGCTWVGSNLWMNQTAVTRISLSYPTSGPFAAGSRADLYGITTNPIATGA